MQEGTGLLGFLSELSVTDIHHKHPVLGPWQALPQITGALGSRVRGFTTEPGGGTVGPVLTSSSAGEILQSQCAQNHLGGLLKV